MKLITLEGLSPGYFSSNFFLISGSEKSKNVLIQILLSHKCFDRIRHDY